MTSISGATSFFLSASPLDSIWIVYLFVVLFEIVETGGSNDWATFGDYFGRKSYGRLRGFTQLTSSPRVLLAPVFAGWWYDRVESYIFPHWIFTALIGLGAPFFRGDAKAESTTTSNTGSAGRLTEISHGTKLK